MLTQQDALKHAPAPDVEATLFAVAGDREAGLSLRGERRPDGTWRVTIRRARAGGPERDLVLPAEMAAAIAATLLDVLVAPVAATNQRLQFP